MSHSFKITAGVFLYYFFYYYPAMEFLERLSEDRRDSFGKVIMCAGILVSHLPAANVVGLLATELLIIGMIGMVIVAAR